MNSKHLKYIPPKRKNNIVVNENVTHCFPFIRQIQHQFIKDKPLFKLRESKKIEVVKKDMPTREVTKCITRYNRMSERIDVAKTDQFELM